MKKYFIHRSFAIKGLNSFLILIMVCLLFPVSVYTQGNAASATLELKSTTQGILIPRLTEVQRNAIPSPANGLLIYNNVSNTFNYYNGVVGATGNWYEIQSTLIVGATGCTGCTGLGGGVVLRAVTGATADASAMMDIDDQSRGVLFPRMTTSQITGVTGVTGLIIYNNTNNVLNYFDGSAWRVPCATAITGATGVAGSQAIIGTAINTGATGPDQSSIFDLSSTTKGILIPRLTNAQRNNLKPVQGLTIYNTENKAIEYYNSTAWYRLEYPPPTPAAITGPTGVCQGATGVPYSVSAISNATSYVWTYSGGDATIHNGASNSVTIDFLANSGNLNVKGTNACGDGAVSADYAITVNTPTITLASNAPSATSQCEGTKKVVIQSFSLAVTNCNGNLTQVNFTTTGTYVAADITKYQLWYQVTNSIFGSTQLGSDLASSGNAGARSFTSLSPTLTAGNTYYFWITADIAASVTNGHTIAVNAIAIGDLTSTSAKAGGPATAGGTQTLNNGCLATYPGGTPDSTVVKFTNTGATQTNYTWTVPSGVTQVRYLVVAGGAGGYSDRAGGGGAGGYRTGTGLPVSISVNVTVGAGGAANTNGSNSVFSSITSSGGGAGRGWNTAGVAGGSGGGAGVDLGAHSAGGSGNVGSYSPVEGYKGGDSYPYTSGHRNTGGGGGSFAPGVGTTYRPDGGAGTSNSITGTPVFYAGGGGGGDPGWDYTSEGHGLGGSSIGGNGGGKTSGDMNAGAGAPNTGSGGGGTGGAGGSGVVIIKYATP